VIAGQGISTANIAAHSLPPKAFVLGFHAIFLFGAAVGGLLLVLNLALRDKKKAPNNK
jgi:urea transporter